MGKMMQDYSVQRGGKRGEQVRRGGQMSRKWNVLHQVDWWFGSAFRLHGTRFIPSQWETEQRRAWASTGMRAGSSAPLGCVAPSFDTHPSKKPRRPSWICIAAKTLRYYRQGERLRERVKNSERCRSADGFDIDVSCLNPTFFFFFSREV